MRSGRREERSGAWVQSKMNSMKSSAWISHPRIFPQWRNNGNYSLLTKISNAYSGSPGVLCVSILLDTALHFPSHCLHGFMCTSGTAHKKAVWIEPESRGKDSLALWTCSAELCCLLENKIGPFHLLIQYLSKIFWYLIFNIIDLHQLSYWPFQCTKQTVSAKCLWTKHVVSIPWIYGTYGFSISKLGSKAFKTTCKTNQ